MPLEPKDWVAGYAAVVATASLGWQIWNSYRAKRPQVALLLDTWRSSQAGGRRTLDSAEVRILNREDYTIRVERVYFKYGSPPFLYGPSVPADIEAGEVDALPFEVPPRDVMSLTLRPSQTFGWRSGSEPPTAIVMELRTGERYVSRSTRQ